MPIPEEGLEKWLERTNQSNTKTVHTLKRRADEMSIVHGAAYLMRERFLNKELNKWKVYLRVNSGDIPYADVPTILEELESISKARNTVTQLSNEVTQDMIELAKKYKVDKIIQFVRGTAKCFAHEDKKPSMYYANRINMAICPVCNKKWDSIQILVERDGIKFLDAVRQLCLT